MEIDTYSEQFRHECECRHWLKITHGDPIEVDALAWRIRKHRGEAAAERVRQGMRAEYIKQRAERDRRGK